MAQNFRVPEMETEDDYRVKLHSKKIVLDQLEKYRELVKKLLDGQSTISEEVKLQISQELLLDFERGVQENILINGQAWDDAPDDEADCKNLDDLLDENILETTLKRSSYPKKILPYVVRSLKAERELMGLYTQAVKPQEMKKDPVQETVMSSLSEAAPKITRQASAVMKSLQGLQQKAAGVCQVLSMQSSGESLEIHREVFDELDGPGRIPCRVARSRLPLKTALLQMEQSSAYARPAEETPTAANTEES